MGDPAQTQPLDDTTEERLRELSFLYQLNLALRRRGDEAVLADFLERLAGGIPYDAGVVFRRDVESHEVVPFVGRATGHEVLSRAALPEALRDMSDVTALTEDDRASTDAIWPEASVRAGVVVPLRVDGQFVGAMALGRLDARPFSRRELRMLRVLGEQVAHTMDYHLARQALEKQVRELGELRDHALAASHAKGDFLATMSHELRTPLNAVIGMTQLLAQTELTPHQHELVRTVRKSGEILLTIIHDILDFSKIEAGRLELDTQPFNLRACVEEVINILQPDAGMKGLSIVLRCSSRVPQTVYGDALRLRQILINLINNAIKFTHEGGVWVKVWAERLGVTRASDRTMFKVNISVRDSGIGIARPLQEKLFQTFSQVDSSARRRYGGTGLGLVICKRLCEMMGGDIRVESEPGAGTTFSFSIRIPGDVPQPGQCFTPEHSAPQKLMAFGLPSQPPEVLVVEDNPVNQRVIQMLLQKIGCRSDVASNGHEAIQAMVRKTYPIVLMDLQMPEMDGITATREIRARWTNGPKIVALTANAFEEDREQCLRAGMNDFLTKPVRLDQLAEVILRSVASPAVERTAWPSIHVTSARPTTGSTPPRAL